MADSSSLGAQSNRGRHDGVTLRLLGNPRDKLPRLAPIGGPHAQRPPFLAVALGGRQKQQAVVLAVHHIVGPRRNPRLVEQRQSKRAAPGVAAIRRIGKPRGAGIGVRHANRQGEIWDP